MLAVAAIHKHVLLRSALAGLWLIIALPVAIMCVTLVGNLSATEPGVDEPSFFIPFLIPFLLAGGLWARSLGRIGGYMSRSLLVAGALGVAVSTGIAIAALTVVEANLTRFVIIGLPVQIVFMLAFTLAALLLAGGAGLALGVSLHNVRLAGQLAIGGGVAGALAFLAIAIGFDSMGFRVGAPQAEEHITMIISSVVGLWATAIVGSAMIGHVLRTGRKV